MTLPPTSDQDAAPPLDTNPPVAGWRRLIDNDPFTYGLTFCVMVACCLLFPKLLNNMIFVFVMLMAGVWLVPQLLQKYFGSKAADGH
jgi:hypothetical protein